MTGLADYRRKRDFRRTPEPAGRVGRHRQVLRFVIQKHAARRLHYDFRLEFDGALKSWAVPRGPSLDPADKRLAVQVEDHPLDYAGFEGVIPEKQYGAGSVLIWDQGTWAPLTDPYTAFREGRLKFELEGQKLHGAWSLVRMGDSNKNWLLIKECDADARRGSAADIVGQRAESVISGRTIDHIADNAGRPEPAPRPEPRPEIETPHAPLPDSITPPLATLVEHIPAGGHWLYEIKYDGYRILARLQNRNAHCFTRNGHDWTAKLPALAHALARLPAKNAWIDGEIIAVGANGKVDFQKLQNAFEEARDIPMVYWAFDLPYLDGRDLRRLPLVQRKQMLAQLLEGSDTDVIRFSDHVTGQGQDLLRHACEHGLEGVIGKNIESSYAGGRSGDWIKLKCRKRQEFVIVGFTDPKGTRAGFGALLLGVYEQGRLRYAGRVGSGFDEKLLRSLSKTLRSLEQPLTPIEQGAVPVARDLHWVPPKLVAEINFAEWTDEQVLRQASFVALREDKNARSVARERAASTGPVSQTTVAGVALSHQDRIIYPNAGITKLDLARYYETVGDLILPHLRHRPLTLVRCPRGQEQPCFFQKHANEAIPEHIEQIAIRGSEGVELYMVANTLSAIVGLIQMGALELHSWGSIDADVDAPDRMILDLDPDPSLPWTRMIEAARMTRELLSEIGLRAFLKTTGGKGLHVVVPLVRRHSWDEVKTFSQALAQHLATTLPQRFTANMAKAARRGKIYVDYLRNARGATAVAAFSTRARPNASISVPIEWDELTEDLRSDSFTVKNIGQRLKTLRRDPWRDYARQKQRITLAMKRRLGMVRD